MLHLDSGPPKTIDVRHIVIGLQTGYKPEEEPLKVRCPPGGADLPIESFSIKYMIGASRGFALLSVLEAATHLHLSDVQAISDSLTTCLSVKVLMVDAANVKDMIYESIGQLLSAVLTCQLPLIICYGA